MTFGKSVRWNRLFHTASGKLVTLAIDHGTAYRFDLPPALAAVRETAGKFARAMKDPHAAPDAIVAQRGLFGDILKPFCGKVPLMLQAVSITPDRPDASYLISNVADAIALGADAIAVAISVGGATQERSLRMLGRVTRRARAAGMPVVAHVYPLGEEFRDEPYSPRGVAYAARAGFEIGADAVKVHYTGDAESFARIVAETPIPVMAAGGPPLDSPLEVLRMARDVAASGAAGITIGRNLWGDRDPPALLRAIKRVVHDGMAPEKAFESYQAAAGK